MQSLPKSFEAFRAECMWLRQCYNTHAALFESSEATKQLLHNCSAIFFSDLNRMLIEYIFLQSSKITDPAKTGKRTNLTVSYINNELEKLGYLSPKIRFHADGIMRYREFVIGARNRLISHLDTETAMQDEPVGAHTTDDVTEFFEHLQEYCDAVGRAVGVGPLDFRYSPGQGDVQDLISLLKHAAK